MDAEDNDPCNLRIFRNHSTRAQPFKVGYVDDKVVDAGGPFRALMSDVMEELQDEKKIKCLKRTPSTPPDGTLTFMINEKSDEEDDLLICLGALLTFSFLTG